MLYFNLEVILKENKIQKKEIAKILHITPVSISYKLNGKRKFNQDEMYAIKNIIIEKTGKEYSLEYLFSKEI